MHLYPEPEPRHLCHIIGKVRRDLILIPKALRLQNRIYLFQLITYGSHTPKYNPFLSGRNKLEILKELPHAYSGSLCTFINS